MTDVIILHNIPGAKAGSIVPLDERMKQHVAAGNARLLPGGLPEHDGPEPDAGAAPLLTGSSTGVYDEDAELEAAERLAREQDDLEEDSEASHDEDSDTEAD